MSITKFNTTFRKHLRFPSIIGWCTRSSLKSLRYHERSFDVRYVLFLENEFVILGGTTTNRTFSSFSLPSMAFSSIRPGRNGAQRGATRRNEAQRGATAHNEASTFSISQQLAVEYDASKLALFLDAGGAVADEVMAAFRAALRGRRADVRIRAALSSCYSK